LKATSAAHRRRLGQRRGPGDEAALESLRVERGENIAQMIMRGRAVAIGRNRRRRSSFFSPKRAMSVHAALNATENVLFRRSSVIGISEILSVRIAAVNFRRHHLNLLRIQRSAKHGPRIRKAHSPTAAHPGQCPQKTSRPRTARYAVPVRRPVAPGALARRPRLPIARSAH
jgi:hypothetical protein